jgi:hypothetical protein
VVRKLPIGDLGSDEEPPDHVRKARGIGFYDEEGSTNRLNRRHIPLNLLGTSSSATSSVALGLRWHIRSLMVMHGIPKLTSKGDKKHEGAGGGGLNQSPWNEGSCSRICEWISSHCGLPRP